MTFPGDGDGSLEELLRNALRGEADLISPAGDGLARIQERVATRRQRQWWVRPILALGSVTLVAAAGVGAYIAASHPSGSDTISTDKNPPVFPTASQTSAGPSPSPSHTAAPAPAFPAAAFYPFTSGAAEAGWEAQNGAAAQPWIIDPVAAAKQFVTSYVLADSVTTVMANTVHGRTAAVTLGRYITDGTSKHPVKVTTVRLQRYGQAWLVVGADDPNGNLRIASPSSGARVASPLTVTGPAYGVDEAVQVDVRAIGAPYLAATRGSASFGNGSASWTTTVPFTMPDDPRGSVVVIENSAADGLPGRIVVTGVSFASDATGYPAYFYGARNGRIVKFSSRNGAALSYLTPATQHARDPQMVDGRVFYLNDDGPCATTVWSVATSGGAPQPAGGKGANTWHSDVGYRITSYGVWSDKSSAMFETACLSATTPRSRYILNSTDNDTAVSRTGTDWPSMPPGFVGGLAPDLDEQHFDAVFHTGTRNEIRRFDGYGHVTSGGTAACSGYDVNNGEPSAAAIDLSGHVWFATRTGSAMQVVRCIGSTPRVMFSVAGNEQPADLAVAGSGGAVLLTATGGGNVWRWSERGGLVKLTPKQPIDLVAW